MSRDVESGDERMSTFINFVKYVSLALLIIICILG